MLRNRRTFLGTVAAAACFAPLARAQEPQLRIVVPFSAGSGTDLGARVIGQAINKTTGRVVIVDNKPGAGSVIGSLDVARSRPDGSTVLYTTGGHTTNAVLMKNLPFDSVADFTPIILTSRSSGFALLVPEKSPYRTIDQYVAAAKAQPGRITFGSSGVGNTTHVIGVLFAKGVGAELLHVPFKGTPANELVSGVVDSAFLSPAVAAQQIRAGQLRALGISGTTRSPMLPEVATFSELGLKVQDIPAWAGIFGPAKMPPDVVRGLYETFDKAIHTPAVKTYTEDNGGVLDAMPPDKFKPYVASEVERLRKLLPPLGIQMG